MAEYIAREAVEKMIKEQFDLDDNDLRYISQMVMDKLPNIDLEDYIPIKYVQDFCKDCADEGIGDEAYMEYTWEAIVKSWLAVKDTDFGKKYKR